MSELLLEKLAREVSEEEMKKIKRKYMGLGAGIGALVGGGVGTGTGILSGSAVAKKAVFPKIDKQMQTLRDEETAIHNEALKSFKLRKEELKNKEEKLDHLFSEDNPVYFLGGPKLRSDLEEDYLKLRGAENREQTRNFNRNADLNFLENATKAGVLKKAKKLGLGGGIVGGAGTGATAGAVIGNALARRKINKLLGE